MAKNFQLIQLTVDRKKLKEMTNRSRNQLVGCMHAHNELVLLNRLLMFTMNDTADGELHDSAMSVQMWSVMQLLAAKLVETWALLHGRFLQSNPPDIVDKLDPKHQQSLQWLTVYFGSGKPFKENSLTIIRDKTAFHYERLNLTKAVDELAGTENCVYVAQHPANSLYYMGSALVFRAIFTMIADRSDGPATGTEENRTARGTEIALDDLNNVNWNMHMVLYGLIRLLLIAAGGPLMEEDQQVRINVLDAPKPERVGIPAFVDVGLEQQA